MTEILLKLLGLPDAAGAGGLESMASDLETDLNSDELLMAVTLWTNPEQFKVSLDELVLSGRIKIGFDVDREWPTGMCQWRWCNER